MTTGKEKLLRQMAADGVKYIFGNPGTVEQGLLDELQQFPEIKYITCMHETVAVAMADGYARSTGLPSVVQLHSGVGLGNGIGMLYQAYRGHSPLIVIAGEAGIRYDAMDAQMACDLVEMARPVTKYAARTTHQDSLLRLWRRAYKMALTPPMGPVFLCLPMDILDAENNEAIWASPTLDFNTSPSSEQTDTIAEYLTGAKHPIILAGDGVNAADAVNELERCVALLGAPVYGVNSSCLNIGQSSPYYRGDLGHMFGKNSKKTVQDADVVMIVGTYLFPEVFPCLDSPFRPDAKIIHVDLDAYEIAKNHPVTMGICANPRLVLKMLNARLEQMPVPIRSSGSKELLAYTKELPLDGSTAAAFVETLAELSDEHLIIFDEALTASGYVTAFLPRTRNGTYFQTRGGSLGVGIPGVMGIQLAQPDANVLAFTGDGGSMYTIQALHTACRYHIPAKFVICNNKRYHLLDQNMEVYWKEQKLPLHQQPECFSLEPIVDFVTLARSMGVDGVRASTPEEARTAAKAMMSAEGPFLVDLNTAD